LPRSPPTEGCYKLKQRDNLYRRSSGIYVLRITVPVRYRSQFGQSEIHVSTQTTDHNAAKAVALHLLIRWQSCISELEHVNEKKVVEGSPLLTGAGLISIQDFCDAFEVAAKLVLQEVLNNNIPVMCMLNAQPVYLVADYTLVDRQEDTGGFVLNSALQLGIPQTYSGFLIPFHRRHTIMNLIENGYSEETAFRFEANNRQVAFCDLPGMILNPSSVFITKVQAERIRAPWVKASLEKAALLAGTSSTITPALRPPSIISPTFESRFCNPRFSEMTSSSLLQKFFEHKTADWGPSQKDKMTTFCTCFIELMGNPKLGAIDRELVRQYETMLTRMPAHRDLANRRHGTNNATKLIELADKHNEERLSVKTVQTYLRALSQLFRWAVTEDYLGKNPAESISQKTRGAKARPQDGRDQFNQDDLNEIFSAAWFQLGGAKRNKAGELTSFRPYYYWLPLIGLHCGARLNEISQLYLDDIIEYETDKFYIFVSDATPETVNTKKPTKAHDKSIKNPNSKRVIPIHPLLIELGLVDYVKALKSTGEERLFPELIYDEVKGYGKAAGRWFNEHFLGRQLNFERDGMKAFHSFRHTFVTSLINKATPEYVISGIVGHERGETTSLKRYGKDDAERLYPYVAALDFELPTIQPFKAAEGIAAIRQALRRRRQRS